MDKKILIVLTHPDFASSNANKALINFVKDRANVTIHNIYEAYPDGKINVEKEQALLTAYDRIILQYPTFWFSVPGLFKEWLDKVLTYGWAYGSTGEALKGKEFGIATTVGSSLDVYQPEVLGFTVDAVILPVLASFKYCGLTYLGHAVVYKALQLTPEAIEDAKEDYLKLFA